MNALVLMDGIILTLIGVIVVIIAFLSREFTWALSFIGLCILSYKQPLIITLPIIIIYNFIMLVPLYRVVNENHIKQPFTREQFGEITAFSLFLTAVIFIIGHVVPLFMDDQLIQLTCEHLPLNACKLIFGYE